MSEGRCRSCFANRNDYSPSSTNDFARLPYDRHQTPLNFLNLNAPKGAITRRKVILLGDTLCGKTFLASAWSQGDVPEEDTPVMNHFIRSTKIRDRQIELVIWDNTGREGYEMMRRLSYEDAHIVLICFDISDPDSFENIDYMWSVEANEYLRDLPKILVGCKKDLRNDNAKLDSLRRQHFIPISPYAADRLAIKIQALAYFETSAIKKQGLSELFDYVAEAALRTVPKSKTSGIRKALSRGI
ncbi:P-loop containing nucleoside triphosphate hydrolase protein [Alternaria alternata]|nr:P-loop containing nucleoside triphosphate hydrolase protein [Alternaria alternata]OAG23739.1 P-loop containing nucleoside triphosphate hydrolase protein [Alternaria alternata]